MAPVNPDPPVKFLDDEKKSKYIIGIDRDGEHQSCWPGSYRGNRVCPLFLNQLECICAGDAVEPPAQTGMRTIVMADKTGKKYSCLLPADDQTVAANATATAGQVPASPCDGVALLSRKLYNEITIFADR